MAVRMACWRRPARRLAAEHVLASRVLPLNAVDLVTLLHVLLFCYWLGGDIGVFYSSGFVVDASRRREQRLMAAKIMLALDLVPRICMSLMLTVGGVLSELRGIAHPTWQLFAIVLLGPCWLAIVLLLHFGHDGRFIPALTRIDRALRWLVIVSIIGSLVCSFYSGRLGGQAWLGAKLLSFAFLVFCGLMIRRGFDGFANGYMALMEREPTSEENAGMTASLRRVRPWVVVIWVVLVLEAYLGIAKPSFR